MHRKLAVFALLLAACALAVVLLLRGPEGDASLVAPGTAAAADGAAAGAERTHGEATGASARRPAEGVGGPGPASAAARAYPAVRESGVLAGVVVDPFAFPVAGAELRVTADLGRCPMNHAIQDDREVTRTALSDARGRFRFEGLPCGPFTLSGHDARGRTGEAMLAVVAAEDLEPVRLVLSEPDATSDFTVRVLDEREQPVPGAAVDVVGGILGVGIAGMGALPPLTATTDVAGRCVFGGRRMRGAVVTARAPDGRVGRASVFRMENVDEVLQRGGLVVHVGAPGQLDGALVGAAPERLAGTRVVAHALNADVAYSLLTYGVSVESPLVEGRFAFSGLPAGSYTLTLRSPQGLRLVLPRWKDGDDEHDNSVQPLRVEVPAGQAAHQDLQVVVGGAIAGVVTRADGTPVVDAEIVGFFAPRNASYIDTHDDQGVPVTTMENDPRVFAWHPETHPKARTDKSGHYLLAGLQPGVHRVEVYAAGLTFDRRTGLRVQDGERLELRHVLEPAGVLQGVAGIGLRIAIAREGEPQPRHLFELAAPGTFTAPGLPAGWYRLTLGLAGPQLARVEVRAGATTWIDLRAHGEPGLAVVVQDAQGPVAGARVTAHGRARLTDPEGKATLPMLPIQDEGFTLDVVADELVWRWELPRTALAPQEPPRELRLGGAELQVTTQDADGQPVAAVLSVSGSLEGMLPGWPGQLSDSTLHSEHGEQRLRRLHPGKYQVHARFADGTDVAQEVQVPAQAAVVLRQPATGDLLVSVRDESGRPGSNLEVEVEWGAAGGPVSVSTLAPLLESGKTGEVPAIALDARMMFESLFKSGLRGAGGQGGFTIAFDGDFLRVSNPNRRTARTGADGKALLRGIPVGEARVTLPVPGLIQGSPLAERWPKDPRAVRVFKAEAATVDYVVPRLP